MRARITKKDDAAKADQVYRLADMDVQEVSMVDRAANQRKFLVVKSLKAAPLAPETSTPPIVEPTPAPPAPPAPGTGAPHVEPTLRIAPEIKDELTKRLLATLSGLEALRKMVDGAEVVQGLVEVPAEIVAAVTQILTVLSEGEVEKAQWTTAYVNDLPDSAFLHIKPGGTKDDEGKTTPRSLRMFPVKDANGAVDLPHLRNALARIPQSSLDQSVKDALTTKGKGLLATATKADLEKRLPQLTDTRKAVLSKARALAAEIGASMDALLAEVADAVDPPTPASAPPAAPPSIGKSDGLERLEAVIKSGMEKLATAQQQLAESTATAVKKTNETVQQVASTRDTPASAPEPSSITKSEDDDADVAWPLDMNDGNG